MYNNRQDPGRDWRPHVVGAEEDHYHRHSGYEYSGGVSQPHSDSDRHRSADRRADMRKSGYNDNFMFQPAQNQQNNYGARPSRHAPEHPREPPRDVNYPRQPPIDHPPDYPRQPPVDHPPDYPREPPHEPHYRPDPTMDRRPTHAKPFNYFHGQTRATPSHLYRPPPPIAQSNSQLEDDFSLFLEDVVDQGFERLGSGLDPMVWGKLLYLERDCIVAKFNLREPQITIDGSRHEFDTHRIGLGFYDNPTRDERVTSVRKQIGKGLSLRLERDGSVTARRLGDTGVFVAETERPLDHCFSHELIEYGGQVPPHRHIPILDMNIFKDKLSSSIGTRDEQDVDLVSLVWLSLVDEQDHMLHTPAWLLLLHYDALRHIREPPTELRQTSRPGVNQGAGRKRTVGRGEGQRQSRIVNEYDHRRHY